MGGLKRGLLLRRHPGGKCAVSSTVKLGGDGSGPEGELGLADRASWSGYSQSEGS